MRLRRLAIQAASGFPIGRPNASTPAVARLKPRRQDPRDAQRTFPRLSGLNPRTSACGRALGTSGSLWRAACPFKRATPQWDGDSAQASPARLSALRRFAPRAASKPAHRRIFGESAQASVRVSPRREVAPQGRRQQGRRQQGRRQQGHRQQGRRQQGRRQQRRRCRVKHQPARCRIAACANAPPAAPASASAAARFAPPRSRVAGPSPAAQALPGQTSACSSPHRCLRQCPACDACERQRSRSIRHAAKSRRRAVASGAGAAGPSISPLGAASLRAPMPRLRRPRSPAPPLRRMPPARSCGCGPQGGRSLSCRGARCARP